MKYIIIVFVGLSGYQKSKLIVSQEKGVTIVGFYQGVSS